MKYYDLFDDMESLDRWHLGMVSVPDGTEPRLTAGIHFEGGQLSAPITAVGRALDFSLNSFAVPIATRRLAESIRAVAGTDVQCIPIEIVGRPDMFVLNSLRLVRCLDEKRSSFTKWSRNDHRPDLDGQYKQVTRLVLDPDAIPHESHFFRVDWWPIALIVSEVLRRAMERVGCVGAVFTEVTPPPVN